MKIRTSSSVTVLGQQGPTEPDACSEEESTFGGSSTSIVPKLPDLCCARDVCHTGFLLVRGRRGKGMARLRGAGLVPVLLLVSRIRGHIYIMYMNRCSWSQSQPHCSMISSRTRNHSCSGLKAAHCSCVWIHIVCRVKRSSYYTPVCHARAVDMAITCIESPAQPHGDEPGGWWQEAAKAVDEVQ